MDKRNIQLIGAIAIMLAASLWAIDGAVLQPRLYTLDPWIVVFLEHAIAFAYMIPLLLIERRELLRLKLKDWSAFGWIALFGGAIGTLAITKAYFSVFLDHVSSISVVVILQKTQPLFAILFAAILLKERPGKMFFLWVAFALFGSYLVAFGFALPDFSSPANVLAVPLFALLASFAFGSSTVLGKHGVSKVNFRVATYLRFGLTSFIMILGILILGRSPHFAVVSLSNVTTLLIIAFSTGGVAIFIYYYGLKRVPASRATIFELMYPVVALVLDYFVNHKILSIGQFIGALLLAFAIFRITRLPMATPKERPIKKKNI